VAVPVVALYGALNALLNVALALRVSVGRLRQKVSLGTGDSRALEIAVRTHANSAEFVPLALVLLLIAELLGGSSLALHALGGTLLVARVLHAIGMERKAPNVPRALGAILTYLLIAGVSAWLLVLRAA
jgi:uncharacterized membrane protein YecN with MAPEG domain